MAKITTPDKVSGGTFSHTEYNDLKGSINALYDGAGDVKSYATVADLPTSVTGIKLASVLLNADTQPDLYLLIGTAKFIVSLIPQQ